MSPGDSVLRLSSILDHYLVTRNFLGTNNELVLSVQRPMKRLQISCVKWSEA